MKSIKVLTLLVNLILILSLVAFIEQNYSFISKLSFQFKILTGGWKKALSSLTKATLGSKGTAALVILATSIVIGVYSNIININQIKFGLEQLFPGSISSSIMQSRFRNTKRTKEYRFAIKNGGSVGGIANDGNTCFMNSVIQLLASSTSLLKFIDGYLYQGVELNTGEIVRTNQVKTGLEFTSALKTLLDGVNGQYGTKGKEFSTRSLLQNMPNGPKQNFFLGYNQEDAQEFYQLVFEILEKEHKKLDQKKFPDNRNEKESEGNDLEKYVERDAVINFVYGLQNLGYIGSVYVPAVQVDPNTNDPNKYLPLDLITPVDGITVERVGCLTCGEHGGIRYAVNSGLSLNLPNTQQATSYHSYELYDLLNEWIAPEIIENVNCNRCGLEQTQEFLREKIEETPSSNEKLALMYQKRIDGILSELTKNYISDEVFDKLTIKQMIRKTKKSKQILFSRPPALLSMHINRSVFDPRTYQIVKNSSHVTFPVELDLSKYTADPDHINTDARLSLKKEETDEDLNAETTNSSLIYSLKAVISHYGTHNYGHYICYRRLRGTWWRISDESVYVVAEDEVINSQGTFMLFYEYNDGSVEELEQLTEEEDEEEEEVEEDEDEGEEAGEDRTNSDGEEDGKFLSSLSKQSTSSKGSETEEISDKKEEDENEEEEEEEEEEEVFNTEDSRAFHI